MAKPIHEFKPNLMAALVPHYFRNVLYVGLFFLLLYFIAYVASLLEFTDFWVQQLLNIPLLVGVAAVLAFLPLSLEALKLMNTTYYFYETRVVYKYKLFVMRNYSANYNQVVNLKTIVGIWGRITNSGDIIVHTADDSRNDLRLKYVSNPEDVEKKLNKLISGMNSQSSSTSNDFSFK